jgi:mRNA interferase RelE/StbE
VAYRVEIENRCLRELKKLDRRAVLRAFELIEKTIARDPHAGKALAGRYKGLFSWRFSSYHVVYEIQEKRLVIVVLRISHRKDVYEGL